MNWLRTSDWVGAPPEALITTAAERRRVCLEVGIVLLLGLGQSAVYSLLSLTARLTSGTPLAQQSAAINPSRSDREWLDFSYQFLNALFPLVLVALALYLLWRDGSNPFRRIGLNLRSPGRDLARGIGLVAIIGIPGIGLYLAGRALGLTVAIEAGPSAWLWWSVPVLLLVALRAATTEEIVGVGYLFTRLRQLGWSPLGIIVAAALFRGSYHAYQGVGPLLGNVLMGLVFGVAYLKWGRVMPLVVAHFMIDAVAFVGYPLALALWPALFGA